MDVVKKNIEKLNGTITIEEGNLEGTSFLISTPHFEKKAQVLEKDKTVTKKQVKQSIISKRRTKR